MKRKIKFLFSFILITCISLTCVKPDLVIADSCPTYTEVYMFTELTGYSHISNSSDGETEFTLTRQKAMEGLPRGAKINGTLVSEMSKSERSNLGSWKTSFSTSELTDFWTNYLLADQTGSYSNGNTTYNVNTNYYDSNKSLLGTGTKISEISGITVDKLVTATVMPDSITPAVSHFGFNGEDFNFTITRKYNLRTDSRSDLLTVSSTWSNVYVSPALYTISYQLCDSDSSSSDSSSSSVVDHTLTVNYWYDSVGEKKAADSHVETLSSGDSYSVDSPKIDGYTASKSNVSGTMGDEDIVIDVVYSAKTGEIAMGIIWFIGLAGLGYGIYYYNKANKKEKEEL